MIEELEKIIKKAAIDGTLTESAVKEFDAILKENQELKSHAEVSRQEVAEYVEKLKKANSEKDLLRSRSEGVKERETRIAEREKNMVKLELEAEHQAQRVEDHIRIFSQVFRNTETRRTIFTPVPAAQISDTGVVGPSGFVQQNVQTESQD